MILDTFSAWIKRITGVLKPRIRHVKTSWCTVYPLLSKPEVMRESDMLHANYVLVPADKACSDTV